MSGVFLSAYAVFLVFCSQDPLSYITSTWYCTKQWTKTHWPSRDGEDKEDEERRVVNESQKDTEERPVVVAGSILHEKRVQGRLLGYRAKLLR